MSDEVDVLLEKAQKQMDAGKYQGALTKYKKVTKLEPDNPMGYFGWAEASIGKSKMTLPEVSQLYKQAMSLDPENILFITAYGEFCFQNGLLPQAEMHFKKAAELDKDNASMIFNDLAFGYMNTGMKFLERLKQGDPETTKYTVMKKAIGYNLQALEMEQDEAIELAKEMIEKKPELIEDEPAQFKELEKNPDGKELLGFLKKEPNNPFLLMEIGLMAFDMGLLEAGENCFVRATRSDPTQSRFFFNDLKMSYWHSVKDHGDVKKENKMKALFFGLKALRIRPEDVLYIYTGESKE